MSDIALKVEGLSKQYHIGKQERYRALRDVLTESLYAPFKRVKGLLTGNAAAAANLNETIWALKDVSFEVKKGEVVGIIGRNGAGKSTLLKILSQITAPNEGRVKLYGRVGALLEVGTGFHPELTGRENIYLNGAILGMSRADINRKFDEIVAFAEVEKFIDTPVKHYSSGLGLRLGFAVAAHLEPEILIVDEVLAVGDVAFQKKCLGKMGDVAGGGRTVMFVSHNMVAIQSLCQRTLWLDAGKCIADGLTANIVSNYLMSSITSTTEQVWKDKSTAPGNSQVRLHHVCVKPVGGQSNDPLTVSMPLVLEFGYWNLEPGAHLNLSLHVYDQQGSIAFATGPLYEPIWSGRPFPVGLFESRCYIPGDLLNDGTYRVELLLVKNQAQVFFIMDNALVFEVVESPLRIETSAWHGKWPGVLRPNLKWTTEFLGVENRRQLQVSDGNFLE